MAVDPYADPQFLAFQRALGADDAQLQAMNEYRKSQLNVGLQSRLPDYDRELQTGQRSIANDFEARGVFGSGTRVARQDEQAGDVQRKVYQDMLGVQGQQGDLDVQLAAQLAANRRKSAEQYLTSSQNQAVGNAQGVLGPMIGA